MVRRFYAEGEKVTALRTNDGKWLVNEISATVPVNGYFWDKPGKHLGSVQKVGGSWEVRWHGAEVAYTRKTLRECVDFLVLRERIRKMGMA